MLAYCVVVAEEGQSGVGKSARAGTGGSGQSTVEAHGQAGGRETVAMWLLYVTSSN